MPVYVLNMHGHPLMPCKPAKARKLQSHGSEKNPVYHQACASP